MLANVPHLPNDPEATPQDQARLRPVEWDGLLARLQAERDLRASLGETFDPHGLALAMAQGSFDPRAAETLFALAAGAGVSGDMPERRFAPEDLRHLGLTGGEGSGRLPNIKPSEANNPSRKAAQVLRDHAGSPAATAAEGPQEAPSIGPNQGPSIGIVSRTE
ncbi:hypothetical protein [Croceicoccus naphthovorans]|uniref:Uncharacterized protein n=1 Tax=Croceicoccus naphthovorans TaxID=1348774 RepID=A0A0G3XIZ8_9SPHN|nr:hypothetical protein [Croceicoccus naphthovorans]AKM11162.1 hypothetical protein AB433_16200 [Croceicoccus naphthovorans]MBB3989953.1 hypothetical protein [Croceicoccus naphthovorans]